METPVSPSPARKASRVKSAAARPRRFGTAQSSTRAIILDAAERLMVDEGYAAVTTRRVAERAGIKAPLVHYYYKTTDDLLVAVYRRGAEHSLQRHAAAMAQGDVLAALWDVNSDQQRTALALEFMAMANHRKFIAEEIARYAEQIRAIQAVALDRFFHEQGMVAPPFDALPLTVILAGVARALVMERGVGITLGHAETHSAIAALLRSFDTPQPVA